MEIYGTSGLIISNLYMSNLQEIAKIWKFSNLW